MAKTRDELLDEILATYEPTTTATNTELEALKQERLNRSTFDWQPQEDSTAQAMSSAYIKGGKLAARDVLGQTSAMTGGMASSYGQQVAQQTYGDYMDQYATEVLPQLEEIARAKYDAETAELDSKIALLQADADTEYQREQDRLSALNSIRLQQAAYAHEDATNAAANEAAVQKANYEALAEERKAIAEAEAKAAEALAEQISTIKTDLRSLKTDLVDETITKEQLWENIYDMLPTDFSEAEVRSILGSVGISATEYFEWLDQLLGATPPTDDQKEAPKIKSGIWGR